MFWKLSFTIVLFCFSVQASAADCEKNPIYCRILEINPTVDHTWAFKLSNSIYAYSNHYEVDPELSIAIAAQENRFQNKTVETVSVRKETTCYHGKCKSETFKKKIYDIGLYQINEKTALAYKCDPNRLMTDIEYSVLCHFKILKSKMEQCKHLGRDSWSCYHSFNDEKRIVYKEAVEKFLRRDQDENSL